ncbi:efflux RND transporter permease subunit [Cellvibrio sp. KY-YJ-3]|uniref:efflux RND transporter permease subunit n=1 Tax=Cellvibrio sp. KY-YJ-3 TaxID=454662 RepID=UPI00124812A6|nr:efflux RND transporter permease subunit [Cellvibrio sp. KY-YJ-3]QEY14075.1 acriflavine resistance protein B [Cellvibrio sp. KY-YJ-3]
MNIAEPFIKRPVAASLLAVAIVLLGLLSWRLLPVAPLPQVDFPAIQVYASLPGASPESMASTVATPLERALGSIPGVTAINSNSTQGFTNIWVEFTLDRNLDSAARDVQAALNAARGQLPAGMPGNPGYRKISPSQAPIMALALSSPNLAPSALYDAASTVLAQKLAQIKGVGQVGIDGASLPAVRIQLNPNALANYGIALDEVRNAISTANVLRPLGLLEEDDTRWQVRTNESLRSAADYKNLVIRYGDSGPVRLQDVATVNDSVENRYTDGFHNRSSAVTLTVSRQTGANIVETIDAINAQLPALRALMPGDTQLKVVMDRSPGIRATLKEAEVTLVLAVLLVVAVVWVFLGSARSALIPSLAIPVAIIGAFVVMYLYGFSLNNLSLMALIVAAGLVVDDAIVVLENIKRHIERGLPPMEAAILGAREVGFTLLAMNITLVVIFVSILLMGGVVEKLFREFSITLAAAMLISLLVSLSLTPALCAQLLKKAPKKSERPGTFDEIKQGYGIALSWALRHSRIVMLLLAAVIGVNIYLYVAIPKTMLPEQDTGQMTAWVRGDDGFSFQLMQPKIQEFRKVLLTDPAVEDVFGASGGGNGVSNAWMRISLKPMAERGVSVHEVVDRIRRQIPSIPGAMMMIGPDQDIRLSSPFSRSEQELLLLSDDLKLMSKWAAKITTAMENMPEVTEVDGVKEEGTQQVVLTIDRETAQRLGVDMATVATLLNNSFSQRQVSTMYDRMNQYRVVMELEPGYTATPAVLEQLQVITRDGERVPLSTFSSFDYGLAEDRVRHTNQFASESIGYGVAEGFTEEQARIAIEQKIGELMVPKEVYLATAGTSRPGWGPSTPGMAQEPAVLIACVLLAVYLILGILYESTIHPLTILSTLPSAGIGALLALRLSDTPFSLIAMLGLFLLIGIVMKNAILMIDFALELERKEGLSSRDSIFQAAMMRLRPIMMTNLAGLLGALPLILGSNEGSELRTPLGITIIGGLAVSQLLTLFTTPVVYLYMEKLRNWGLHRKTLISPLASTTTSGSTKTQTD